MFSLYKKEVRNFLSTIIGYVFIVIYLLISELFHWVIDNDANLLYGSEADLIPFFNLSPVIFLVLIPAITMRTIAEEKRTGTMELLATKPISSFQILFAKFSAAVSLFCISITPTFLYVYSMLYIGDGNMDNGAVLTSYIGLFLLGSCFVSIGIFASSITQSQIIAFVVSMFICWFLFYGFEFIGSYGFMGDFDAIIQNLGISFHYESIKKGVIDSRDIIYFLSIICIFFCLALQLLKINRK